MRLSPLDPLGYFFAGGIAVAHVAARRFEKALESADRALREQSRWVVMHRVKAVAYAHLGRANEARDAASRILELHPNFTISGWAGRYAAVAISPETMAVYIDGLRKAGLPDE